MLELGDLVIALDLSEASAIRALILRDSNRPRDLGDACCLRLAELMSGSVILYCGQSRFLGLPKESPATGAVRFPGLTFTGIHRWKPAQSGNLI